MDAPSRWENKEIDRFLDMVLAGDGPVRISEEIGKSPEEVKAHFKKEFYNRHYQPSMPRIWRGGKKMSQLETRLVRNWKRRGWTAAEMTAILQRPVDEVSRDEAGRKALVRLQAIAPVSDILMAHHYLYHCSYPVISDQAYDYAKKEELEFGGAGDIIAWLDKAPRKVVDYPPHIRSLACYIQFKHMTAQNSVDYNKLPMYFAPDGHWMATKREKPGSQDELRK